MIPLLFTPNPFCTPSAAFFGAAGVTICLIFCNFGSAYGTAKAGVSLAHLGIMNEKKTTRALITAIFASVMSIYGVVMSAILCSVVKTDGSYSNHAGYAHFTAGLVCGSSSLAAGMAIGVIADVGLRNMGLEDKVFIPMILMMIFSEVLAIYGIIVGIMVTYLPKTKGPECPSLHRDPINE